MTSHFNVNPFPFSLSYLHVSFPKPFFLSPLVLPPLLYLSRVIRQEFFFWSLPKRVTLCSHNLEWESPYCPSTYFIFASYIYGFEVRDGTRPTLVPTLVRRYFHPPLPGRDVVGVWWRQGRSRCLLVRERISVRDPIMFHIIEKSSGVKGVL